MDSSDLGRGFIDFVHNNQVPVEQREQIKIQLCHILSTSTGRLRLQQLLLLLLLLFKTLGLITYMSEHV